MLLNTPWDCLRQNERDLSLMTPIATWPCWPASRWISDDGHILGRRTILTAFFFNNLTGTGRSDYIHSTYVAHQTAEWCFDSSYPLSISQLGVSLMIGPPTSAVMFSFSPPTVTPTPRATQRTGGGGGRRPSDAPVLSLRRRCQRRDVDGIARTAWVNYWDQRNHR